MHEMLSPSDYCTKFNLTLVSCLKFAFIEMLDKLITYIVCWYYILELACCVNEPHHNSSLSRNRLDLIEGIVPTHYVCNGCLSYTQPQYASFCICVATVSTLAIISPQADNPYQRRLMQNIHNSASRFRCHLFTNIY